MSQIRKQFQRVELGFVDPKDLPMLIEYERRMLRVRATLVRDTGLLFYVNDPDALRATSRCIVERSWWRGSALKDASLCSKPRHSNGGDHLLDSMVFDEIEFQMSELADMA